MALERTTRVIGRELDSRYFIESLIAEGGMGAVYRARHLASGRPVAVKTVLPSRQDCDETLRRMEREAKTASSLDHPHIVEMLDMGRMDDRGLFLVMELVEGRSVGDLLFDNRLYPRRSLILLRQALDAVGHAHSRGLVHRDLKPDNIMVVRAGPLGSEYDCVKLLDFGVVKLVGAAVDEFGGHNLTASGVVYGTAGYMAPEQATDSAIDHRADLYALGVVLFEMLTGHKPFYDPDHQELLRLHVKQPAPRLADVAPGQPWWTPAMEHLIATALKKRPDQRFADADAMRAALDEAFLSVDHLPNPAQTKT